MYFKKIIGKIRGDIPTLPSDCERLDIDGESTIRYYVYDYENLSNTIAKDKSVLFIDIGANEGQSAHYAYHFFKDVQVISYEPLKSCMHFLECIKQNHSNYIYKNVALAEKKGLIDIRENTGISGLSSIFPLNKEYLCYNNDAHSNDNNDLHEEIIKVQSVTIDDEIPVWEGFGKEIKILKIDTQGSELSILKHAGDGGGYLRMGNVDVIMIEIITANKYIGQANYIDTINFMYDCGFEIFNIKPGFRTWNKRGIAPEGMSYGMADEYDFTFVHKNTLKRFNY